MIPERAVYHQIMLCEGFHEEYDQELNDVLEKADPIPQPELDLALCMSDPNKTISILNNYVADHPADGNQVYEMVLGKMRQLYTDKVMSAHQLANLMYSIADSWDMILDGPWDEMRHLIYNADLANTGIISQDEFLSAFDLFLKTGQHSDIFAQRSKKEKEARVMKNQKFISVFTCCILTFSIDFFLIPQLMRGIPDFIWMAAMVILPAVIAWLFYEKFSRPAPGWLFAGMAAEYGLLIAMAGPISRLFGSSIEHGLGWFSYIGSVFPWPLVVTLVQFLLIVYFRKASPEVAHE